MGILDDNTDPFGSQAAATQGGLGLGTPQNTSDQSVQPPTTSTAPQNTVQPQGDNGSMGNRLALALEAFGAGVEGREPLYLKLQRQEMARRQQNLSDLSSRLDISSKIINQSMALGPEDRSKFIDGVLGQTQDPQLKNLIQVGSSRSDLLSGMGRAIQQNPTFRRMAATDPQFTEKMLNSEAGRKTINDANLSVYGQEWRQAAPAWLNWVKQNEPDFYKQALTDGHLDASEIQGMLDKLPENLKPDADSMHYFMASENQSKMSGIFGIPVVSDEAIQKNLEGELSGANAEKRASASLKEAQAKSYGDLSESGASLDTAAEKFRKTGQLPTNMGRGVQGAAQATQIRKRAAELDAAEGITPEESAARQASFPATIKAIKDFNNGPRGDFLRSANVALTHLGTFKNSIDALQNGDTKSFNLLANKIKTQFGLSAAPTTFDGVREIVGDELTKAVIGAKGALGDREAMKKQLDSANSPKLLNDLVDKYKELMVGQIEGHRQQYEVSTGMGDFDKFLSPSTKAIVSRTKQNAGAASVAPTKITTEEDYKKLPSGAEFIDPKGIRRRKP